MSITISSITDGAVSSITDGSIYQLDDPLEEFSEGFAQQSLFGRSTELQTLTEVFERVKSTNSFETVIIHGCSGSGKTSLTLELRETVLLNKGFFCTGKYFQNPGFGQDPYSAIMAAFSDLCDLILQSEDFDAARRVEIQDALGSDGQLLARAVTNITPFLDSEPQFEIKNESALAKFKVACKMFLRAMPSDDHPVVIFLDDLQWMDAGSKELIQLILLDEEIQNLMLIMAYRDEDEEGYDLPENLKMKKSSEKFVDIPLQNLDLESVNNIICEKLGSESDDIRIRALSELIAHKTHGNPFHVLQFLSLLLRDGFLTKYLDSWIFDLECINSETMISESLAELLAGKVRRCDDELQPILKVASLLGYHFPCEVLFDIIVQIQKNRNNKEQNTLRMSVEKLRSFSVEQLHLMLKKSVDQQFLEKTKGGYRFSHDKLQLAFQNLIDRKEKEKLHVAIARRFLTVLSDASMYQAALHLNLVSDTQVESVKDRVELAKINLGAAKYCAYRSAFSDSAVFLRKGLKLIDDEEKWVNNFDLALELTESLAKMEFIVGNLDACKTANKEVLFRAKLVDTKVKSLVIEIEVREAAHESDEMVMASRKVLEVLGIPLPAKVSPLRILFKLRKVRALFDRKTDEQILMLPCSNDSGMSTALSTLVRLTSYGFSNQSVHLRVYFALLAIELSLTKGLVPFTSAAVAIFGVTELSLGQKKRAYRLGELALKLFSHIPCKSAECFSVSRTVGTLLFLKKRYLDFFNLYAKSFNYSFEIGDFFSASFCATSFAVCQICTGENLKSTVGSLLTVYRRVNDSGQDVFLMVMKPILQCVLNLQNESEEWEELSILTGEIMNEEEYMSQCTCDENSAFISLLLFCKMLLAYTFDFHERAHALCEQLKGWNFVLFEQGMFSLPFYFYHAMICYSMYHSTGVRKYRRTARKCKKYISRHHSSGNPNAMPFLKIVEVEELFSRRSRNPSTIYRACNNAIELQVKEGFTNLEALANERANQILDEVKFDHSENYLNQAMDAYRYKWGATAKYKLLLQKRELIGA